MIDFMKISTRPNKRGDVEVFPKFIVGKSSDLMIRGGDFYAFWMEDRKLWSQDEQDVIETIDRELTKYADEYRQKYQVNTYVQYMWDSDSHIIDNWHKYCQKQLRDNYKPLDDKLIFADQEVKKHDYATRKLPYCISEGPTDAYDELVGTLYAPEEKMKIEWAIGAILSGASKKIQKFLVIYGGPGTGKSTVINIMQMLFDGYYCAFNAKALGSSTDNFALEYFKSNPLLAIQQDADLSHIEDNTRLNSLVSHELMTVNEKHKSLYQMRFKTFLVMGSNKPVKITDSKSGILRRLIDVNPTGNKLPSDVYNKLFKQVEFELGHIAAKCKQIYEDYPNIYDDYIPVNMLGETNDFFNFVEDSYMVFKSNDQVTLKEAWEMYKQYCDQAHVQYPYPKRLVKTELKTYFDNYEEDCQDPDTKQHIRNLYSGFKYKLFDSSEQKEPPKKVAKKEKKPTIELAEQPSMLDIYCADCPAQYASSAETPSKKWENVTTTLKDLNTKRIHYVQPPINLIVIDFDLKDESGKKSFERNIEAASKWPKTYTELSKSGTGIHLHYIYEGDPTKLSRIYDEDIEIKVFTGNSALRRKVTKCNAEGVAHINSGLPLKGNADKVENLDIIKSERVLRTMIIRNLNKEYHSATKPSMDFIAKLLDDAYASGMKYDVSDLYNTILAFAAGSTHQSEYCLNLMTRMHFKSDEQSDSIDEDKPLVFFDCEVFPNLLLVNWKLAGKDKKVNRLINPKPHDIENLLQYRLVGFNNRNYDNHIIYAALLGKTNKQIYDISQDIINGKKSGKFGEAYNLSYTDIYDYCSAANKMSLKKWEIKLGITHLELGLPWDQPVPEELWPKVAEYCDNDVISTEAVWEATQADFTARQILAELAGMTVNDTTNSLTTRIIFGSEKHPALVYTDLAQEFPGYKFEKVWNKDIQKYEKHNWYRGIDLGFGGYVYAEPGIYHNVALIDVASLHPSSIINLNLFGDFTKNFKDIKDARVHIKHKEYDKCKDMLGGKLMKYLVDPAQAKKLAGALKTAINSVYGLTSANFDNPFKDSRNENNIVALRGALFMKTLQDEVAARGFTVAHIKTDSIKIPNATPEIIQFCMEFAKRYGYDFEHEATYERICLVNDAVYIAKFATENWCKSIYGYSPEECAEEGGHWTATGTQFQIPYVFKTCFSHEKIVFDDMCEIKEVKTAMYLDFNEGLDIHEDPVTHVIEIDHNKPILERLDKIRKDLKKNPNKKLTKSETALIERFSGMSDEDLAKELSKYHNYHFVGKVGYFCPIKPGCGGAELVKEATKASGDIGFDCVTGTKGYRWLEAANVKDVREDDIDTRYYKELVDTAIDTISQFGDYYAFVA